MPGVMIIRIRESLDPTRHDTLEYPHPFRDFNLTVNDGLIPNHCLLFNLFPVSEPANVCEIGCNRVELFKQFGRVGHPQCDKTVFTLSFSGVAYVFAFDEPEGQERAKKCRFAISAESAFKNLRLKTAGGKQVAKP